MRNEKYYALGRETSEILDKRILSRAVTHGIKPGIVIVAVEHSWAASLVLLAACYLVNNFQLPS